MKTQICGVRSIPQGCSRDKSRPYIGMAGETRLGRTWVHTYAWRGHPCYEMLPHMAHLLMQTRPTWISSEEARKSHNFNKLRTKRMLLTIFNYWGGVNRGLLPTFVRVHQQIPIPHNVTPMRTGVAEHLPPPEIGKILLGNHGGAPPRSAAFGFMQPLHLPKTTYHPPKHLAFCSYQRHRHIIALESYPHSINYMGFTYLHGIIYLIVGTSLCDVRHICAINRIGPCSDSVHP